MSNCHYGTRVCSIHTMTTKIINNLINYNTMAHKNTYLLKISFRLYGKHWNLLTSDERAKVTDIYYDFY